MPNIPTRSLSSSLFSLPRHLVGLALNLCRARTTRHSPLPARTSCFPHVLFPFHALPSSNARSSPFPHANSPPARSDTIEAPPGAPAAVDPLPSTAPATYSDHVEQHHTPLLFARYAHCAAAKPNSKTRPPLTSSSSSSPHRPYPSHKPPKFDPLHRQQPHDLLLRCPHPAGRAPRRSGFPSDPDLPVNSASAPSPWNSIARPPFPSSNSSNRS